MGKSQAVADLDRTLGRWATAAVWAPLPLTLGPLLGDALAPLDRGMQVVASVGAWAIWAAAMVAALVPRPLSLTVVRVVAPGALGAALWASTEGEVDTAALVAAVSAAVAAGVALLPATAAAFVDGASYGSERRMPLRPPGALLLGPLQLAWAVVALGLVAPPLLLADRRWLPGGLALALGLPAAGVALRALHGLSRRWLVFVPAGLVVHDLMTLREPVLFPRRLVRSLGPAPAETTATDLTGGALGLALELDLGEEVSIVPSGRFGSVAEPRSVESLLLSPTRPGAVLRIAAERQFPRA